MDIGQSLPGLAIQVGQIMERKLLLRRWILAKLVQPSSESPLTEHSLLSNEEDWIREVTGARMVEY